MARPDDSIEIDYSEVKDRTYRCLDGCGLCCLCQPELLPEEEKKFRSRPELSEGITEKHISPEVRGAAIKLRGAHGSCYFLSNRRCRIYGDRPHYCRAFPINVFVGWRIQLNANLSCRGMALEGEDLEQVSRSIIDGFGNERLARELRTAKNVFTQFVQNTRAAWVAQSFTSLRNSAELLMDEMVDRTGIARLLTHAEHGTTKQNAPGADIAKLVRKTDAEADVDERAVIDGTELFDLPDLSLLPIYIDEQSNWRIFRLVGKDIIGYVLDEDGSTSEFSRTAPAEVDLLPMDPAAQAAMKDYLAVVNARDCFLGHAAYLCDVEGYEYNLAQVYLGALANNSLDLWWRASFLAGLERKEALGAREIREGIVFFDMDLLDLPTIGAFI